MRPLTCMLLLFAVSGTTVRAAAQQKVETDVEKVTLFIDGAHVTRTVQADLPAGNSTLVFTGLSPYMDEKSLRVTAEGRFTITSVERLFNYTDSLERTERQQILETKLREIERQKKKLRAEREVIEAEKEMLDVNCSVGNRKADTPLTTVRELTEYYAQRLQALKEKSLMLDERSEELDKQQTQVGSELTQLGGKRTAPGSEAQVGVSAPAACKGKFTLTYYVRNAGWFPAYDIRSDGLSEPLQITYKAHLFQNTGEEWNDVSLTLSSSNPDTGNMAPQLRTYWLDYGLAAPRYDLSMNGNTVSGTVADSRRSPIVGASVQVPGSTVGTVTDARGHYSVTVPPGTESLRFNFVGYLPRTQLITGNTLHVVLQEDDTALDEVVVMALGARPELEDECLDFSQTDETTAEEAAPVMEVEQTQNRLGYEFEIKQPYTVHSDGKAVAAEIGRFDLPGRYTYQAVPKVDKDAFLVAEAADWERLNLLQGEANIYFENTFVGKSILDPVQTGDTLRFSLGRDSGIRIERKKEGDYTARRAIGSNQIQTLAWKITVRNTRTEPVSLTLYDQLPVSRNNSITVTEEELSEGRCDKKSGIVSWTLDLAPGEQRELHLRYGVKYPKGQHLAVE